MTAPTTAPMAQGRNQSAAPSLPFQIAARKQTRLSFTTPTLTLSATAPTPVSPIQIPAVGYLSHLVLEVTITATGGTTPTVTADGPFNAIQQINFRNSAGNDLITPSTGYQLYLNNKYGAQFIQAPYSDNKLSRQYSTSAGSSHFFLQVPLEIDASNGLGAIPALASNRSYQLALTMAAISTYVSGSPTVTANIEATAFYWSEPVGTTQSGTTQQTGPSGLGTLSLWQTEQPVLTPGDKFIRSNNVGNVLRTLIFVCRNAAGVRIDNAGGGWPSYTELYLDNDPMFRYSVNLHEDLMAKWYGFSAQAKDVAGGLDTGVYVFPFFALTGGQAGDPNASRAQFLPTLDASLLQLRGNWGANASTLEILTNSVVPTSPAALYAK